MRSPLRFHLALAATAAFASCAASAVEPTMTQGGFTGLEITPNARLLDWGRAAFTYDRQLVGAVPYTAGNNYVLGFGLLPNVEVSGRVAASHNPDNCFVERCKGIRDLSASGKFGIGLDAAGRFHGAFGATDLGGAATNFRSYYGVLTYDGGAYEASAGYANRSARTSTGPRSPLDGPFASAAWQPLPWVRAQLEYADGNAWGGVRLFAPRQWLPEGWSAHIGANARLNSNNLSERSWVSAGISIPLYKVPALPGAGPRAALTTLEGGQKQLPVYEARTLPAPAPSTAAAVPPSAAPAAPPPAAVAPPPPAPASDEALLAVAEALRSRGLEDIFVGRMPDGSIALRANNASYSWNTVDALGAALAAVAGELGNSRTAYRLVLTQRQLPIVAVTGQADCLRQWLAGEAPACTAGELSTPGSLALDQLHAGATWAVAGLQPSHRTLRISISPVLRTSVATEVGVLDYSAGVNIGALLPLWAGGSAELRVQQELAHSNDFGVDGVFYRRRIRNGIERAVLTQTLRLPLERWFAPGDDVAARRWGLAAVTAQATVGRIGSHFDGLHGEMRWEPGEGRHRVSVQGGVFRNSAYGEIASEPERATPLLGTYRYNITPTRTYVEVTAGQFMNNDRGGEIGMRQWFGDVALYAYVRRTRTDGIVRDQAGLAISLPLGPRRDMNPSGLQLTGTPRFTHGIETVVGGGANSVVGGRGTLPPAPSLDAVHNSDRASLLYFEDNVRRLRDAAR